MKTIIITGAGKGIGKEVAIRLAEKNKVFAISRDISMLKASDNLIPIEFDITSDLNKLVSNLAEFKIDKLDVLIHNAGALINKPFEKITENELTYIYKVNVFAPFLMTKMFIPVLKNAKKSHVLCVGSIGGVTGSSKFPGLSAYSSSKSSLSCLAECLAEEYKNQISFNSLALGAVQTEMLEKAFPGYQAPISAKKIAEYITGFALNGHEFINGKTISVSMSNP
jgi:3-oxoacyl-[acyl-carrier protein] reductase